MVTIIHFHTLLVALSLSISLSHGFLIERRINKHHEPSCTSTRRRIKCLESRQRLLGFSLVMHSSSKLDSSSVDSSETSPSPTRSEPFSSRSVAVMSILDDKQSRSTFPLQRLESNPLYLKLDQRDRSFARFLVAETERRMGQIDKVLQVFPRNPNSIKRKQKSDALVEACLRLGACQILFAEVPSYAAVKETVEVLRMIPFIKVSEPKIKFVNAILRKIDREGQALLKEHSSVTDNITPWLLSAWKNDWGDDRAQIIAEASMTQPPVFLSVKYPPQSSDNDRQNTLMEICNTFGGNTQVLPHGSIRVDHELSGAVSEWPLYHEGVWWVQDAAASLPAIALHSALSKQVGQTAVGDMHVVDLCAAPGGKSAQLVSLGFHHVSAIELSPRRSRRLIENLGRLQMHDKCTVHVQDGTEWLPDPGSDTIHGVILDVPCSATGTGSKRPDVLRRDEDISDLKQVQEKLANHCAENLLKPGGVMVYATCSTLKQESEEQVHKLLQKFAGQLETVPFENGEIIGFDDAIDANGWMRVLPGALGGVLAGCDGFFLARLKRIS